MNSTPLARMAVDSAEATDRNAAGVRWDLTHIYPDIETARAEMERVLSMAEAFETDYRERVAGLEGAELAEALKRLGDIQNTFLKVDQYASLRFSMDSRDTVTKDLMDVAARAQEDLSNRLRFFDLEWQSVPQETARKRYSDGAVAPFKHYLERLTAYAPHMRTEAEEAMLAAREVAASSDWQKLFNENLATIEVEFDGGKGQEKHTLDRLLAYARHPDRSVRFAAYETAFTQLIPRADVQAACYNAIVGDRLQMDRLRGFDNPMQATNLANDLSDQVVNTLIDSVQRHYPLAQRWFKIKAGLLGLDKLHLYDQYAPMGVPKEMLWDDAWRTFISGTTEFSSDVTALLEPFLAESRIDAEPRLAKSGGAFCAPVCWGEQPYILMNFTDDVRGVETLAHEAGHALHFILTGRDQNALSAWMGLAIAEVASTFHATVVVDHVLTHEEDKQQRQLLTTGSVESAFAVVFRQVMMAGYERKAYALKADGKALTSDRLSEIWLEENRAYYGDSIELPDDYRLAWSYIPHFIGTRFYTYAYSFAHLASMALYAKYREQGASFIPTYLDILAAGGSQTPQELLASAGIDITDPAWVDPSFTEIERMIDLAEEATA